MMNPHSRKKIFSIILGPLFLLLFALLGLAAFYLHLLLLPEGQARYQEDIFQAVLVFTIVVLVIVLPCIYLVTLLAWRPVHNYLSASQTLRQDALFWGALIVGLFVACLVFNAVFLWLWMLLLLALISVFGGCCFVYRVL